MRLEFIVAILFSIIFVVGLGIALIKGEHTRKNPEWFILLGKIFILFVFLITLLSGIYIAELNRIGGG